MRAAVKRRPWTVPLAVLALVAVLGILPSQLGSAGASTPPLPRLSAAALLAKARNAKPVPLSGTVALTADLGLPPLGDLPGGGTAPMQLLSGRHDAHVWVGGPDTMRVALAAPLQETDWIRNGNHVWLWDSAAQRATHAVLDPNDGTDIPGGRDLPQPGETPVQFAQRLLHDVDPSTAVEVSTPTTVARRPAYELVLSPRTNASLVREVGISVDAATGTPLRVRVTPNGSSTPAVQLAFTDVSFRPPDPARFRFAPPRGATVVEAHGTSGAIAALLGRRGHDDDADRADGWFGDGTVTTVGTNWQQVQIVSGQRLPWNAVELLQNAPRVSAGAIGGHLLQTKLVNLLLLDDGRIAMGAVTPAALEHAVAGR